MSLASLLSSPIEYLKGVGPLRAELLKKELSIYTFGDLLHHFPHRHVDKTIVTPISQLTPEMDFIQVKGVLLGLHSIGEKRSKRMVAQLRDESGLLELAWFQGIQYVQKNLVEGQTYLVFGRLVTRVLTPSFHLPNARKASTLSKRLRTLRFVAVFLDFP